MNIITIINNIYIYILFLFLILLIINIYIYFKKYNVKKVNLKLIKKTLVLDLDETLIHSTLTTSDTYLSIKRPHVEEFLEYVSKKFNVILFTAGMQAYADPIVNDLDNNNKIFQKRYYRDSCIYSIKKQALVKDLNIIGVDMKSIIIIDNTPTSYSLQPQNGIPIISWYGTDKNDKELLKLIPILDEIYNSDDVRSIISKYYQ